MRNSKPAAGATKGRKMATPTWKRAKTRKIRPPATGWRRCPIGPGIIVQIQGRPPGECEPDFRTFVIGRTGWSSPASMNEEVMVMIERGGPARRTRRFYANCRRFSTFPFVGRAEAAELKIIDVKAFGVSGTRGGKLSADLIGEQPLVNCAARRSAGRRHSDRAAHRLHLPRREERFAEICNRNRRSHSD